MDDSREELARFVKKHSVPGIVLWDKAGRLNPTGELWNVQALPADFVLDRHGVIRAKNLRGEDLIKAIERVLKDDAAGRKRGD